MKTGLNERAPEDMSKFWSIGSEGLRWAWFSCLCTGDSHNKKHKNRASILIKLGKWFQLLYFPLHNFCNHFSLHAQVIKLHLTVSLRFKSEFIASTKHVHFISMTIHPDLVMIVRLYSCCPEVIINSITFHLQRYLSLNAKCIYTVNLICF